MIFSCLFLLATGCISKNQVEGLVTDLIVEFLPAPDFSQYGNATVWVTPEHKYTNESILSTYTEKRKKFEFALTRYGWFSLSNGETVLRIDYKIRNTANMPIRCLRPFESLGIVDSKGEQFNVLFDNWPNLGTFNQDETKNFTELYTIFPYSVSFPVKYYWKSYCEPVEKNSSDFSFDSFSILLEEEPKKNQKLTSSIRKKVESENEILFSNSATYETNMVSGNNFIVKTIRYGQDEKERAFRIDLNITNEDTSRFIFLDTYNLTDAQGKEIMPKKTSRYYSREPFNSMMLFPHAWKRVSVFYDELPSDTIWPIKYRIDLQDNMEHYLILNATN